MKVVVISVIVETHGIVFMNLEKSLHKLEIRRIETIQLEEESQ